MRKEQHHKGWNEIKTNDSWAIFKIMGEFVNGFEKMGTIGLAFLFLVRHEQKSVPNIMNWP